MHSAFILQKGIYIVYIMYIPENLHLQPEKDTIPCMPNELYRTNSGKIYIAGVSPPKQVPDSASAQISEDPIILHDNDTISPRANPTSGALPAFGVSPLESAT